MIASGFTPYCVENIKAINPTEIEATIMLVSEILKSMSKIVHIINIDKIGWRIILNKIIKLESCICVLSIFRASIMPAANKAQGESEAEIKLIDQSIKVGISISK